MRYELRKILGNPSLCLLLSAVVIINALMFFARCTDASDGFTMKQMQTKFNDIAAVKLQQGCWMKYQRKTITHLPIKLF